MSIPQPNVQYLNVNQQNMMADQPQYNMPPNFPYSIPNLIERGNIYAINQFAPNQILSNQAYSANPILFQNPQNFGYTQNQDMQSNVIEQQILIPQPPKTQVIQQVYRIPIQVQGPTQRKVIRSLTPKLFTINQPPDVKIVNETYRQPVLVQPPPQVQTVYDRVQKQITVPMPPQIQMQRSEVVEQPVIQQPNLVNNQFVTANTGYQPLHLNQIVTQPTQFSFVHNTYPNQFNGNPNIIANGLMPQYFSTATPFINPLIPQNLNYQNAQIQNVPIQQIVNTQIPLMQNVPTQQIVNPQIPQMQNVPTQQIVNPQIPQMSNASIPQNANPQIPLMTAFPLVTQPNNLGVEIPSLSEPYPPSMTNINSNIPPPPQNQPMELANQPELPPESGFFKESQSVAQPSILLENAPQVKH